MNMKKIIGDRQLYIQILEIAIPIICQSVISIGVNLLDTVMLGKMGDMQLSASSLAGQYIIIFIFLLIGLGQGTSVLSGRFYGMNNQILLKKVCTLMLRVCIILGILFSFITFFFSNEIMSLYSHEQEIIYYGNMYLKYMSFGFLFLGITTSLTNVLRTVGAVRIPLYSSIASFLLNVFLNWVLIFGHFGFPRMEIAGAALATLISRIVEFLVIILFFLFKEKNVSYKINDLLMNCKDIRKEYYRYCLPVTVSDSLAGFGTTAIAMVMGRIGSSFVAANAITSVVVQIATMVSNGVCFASGIITGHTMGKGQYQKAKEDGYRLVCVGILVGLFACIVIQLTKTPLIHYYNELSFEARSIAYEQLNVMSLLIVFISTNSVLTKGVLRAGGDTRFLMIGDVLFLWIVSIPLGALTGIVFHSEAFIVYFCLKIDEVIKCFYCLWRLKSGKWIKKIEAEPIEKFD